MNAFETALAQRATQPFTTTSNNAVALSTAGSALVDFFFKGILAKPEECYNYFLLALNENRHMAIKCLFYMRDIRGIGQGRRTNFRFIMSNFNNWAKRDDLGVIFTLSAISYYGRNDDLLSLVDSSVGADVMDYMWTELNSGNALMAKWMPRESSKKGRFLSRRFAKRFKVTSKEYRKKVSAGTTVVETQMCSGSWKEINFESVPSQCFLKSRKAFQRNAPEEIASFFNAVSEGKKEIKTGTLTPSQIVERMIGYVRSPYGWGEKCQQNEKADIRKDIRQLNLIWSQLSKIETNSLVVADTSGSMYMSNTNLLPIVVCLSLAIYFAERNTEYQGYITFDNRPRYVTFNKKDTLSKKLESH